MPSLISIISLLITISTNSLSGFANLLLITKNILSVIRTPASTAVLLIIIIVIVVIIIIILIKIIIAVAVAVAAVIVVILLLKSLLLIRAVIL